MRLSFRLAVLTLLVFSLAVGAVHAQEADTGRIAVISAFAPELALLEAQVQDAETVEINGVDFMTGTLAGQEVVVFLSGVSMVNAAMTTQLLLDHFDVSHIVYSGIAGGVNPDLHIGDVTVPAQWGQYLESVYARETDDGAYALPQGMGFTEDWPNYGMMFPQSVFVLSETNPDGEARFWFEVAPDMLAVAETVAGSVTLADCTAEHVCLENAPQIVVGGNGVSGQAFVDNAAFRDYVFATFEANVLDMETAAVATVAYANGVPFIAFRSLSDLAGGGPGENEMGTFFQIAADNSAAVVLAFLEAWGG